VYKYSVKTPLSVEAAAQRLEGALVKRNDTRDIVEARVQRCYLFACVVETGARLDLLFGDCAQLGAELAYLLVCVVEVDSLLLELFV